MLRYICIVSAGLFLLAHVASAQQHDWENEQVIGINKLPPVAWHLAYADDKSALQADRDKSPWYESLNGQWKFHWSPDPNHRPADFFKPGFDVSKWDDDHRAGQLADAGLRHAAVYQHHLSRSRKTRRA